MKKTLILYTSNTGNTKKYCEDIASAVSADVMPLKKFKWKKASDYDIVVYGGWIMGGNIKGLNDFLAHWDNELDGKDVIVIGVGMGYPTPDTRKSLINQNILDLYHLRFYQFQGSFDYSKLNAMNKLMMKASLAKLESDPSLTAGEASILDIIERPIDVYDQQKVDKVVSIIKTLSEEAKA